MKLKSARIQNFRCVDDSTEFFLDDVTCLVGKNESGKTTILAALEKLNPSPARGEFTKLDYPRKNGGQTKQYLEPSAIETEWEIGESEVQELEKAFCPGFLKSTRVVITKSYDNVLKVAVELHESAIVNSVLGQVGLNPDKLTA